MSRRITVLLGLFIPLTADENTLGVRRNSEQRGGTIGQPPAITVTTSGTEHACGLSVDGRAWCWGSNRLGQLGNDDPSTAARRFEDRVAVATAARFVVVSAGASHTCALTMSGETYCWGLNLTGELGQLEVTGRCDADFPCSRRPVRLETALRFDTVAAGFGHTCALARGRAYCWGRNDRGQLGDARADDDCAGVPCNVTPLAVQAGGRFTVISAGGDHTCGLADGGAYCWGSNQYDQLGVPTPSVRNPKPLRVASAAVSGIDARGLRTCVTTSDGRSMCWGYGLPSP
jgi:alpha-tubulin suppressor-like RCC1 family protein